LFVTEANINAEERNERIIAKRVTIRTHIDQEKDFELMIYHTAQRVLHIEGQNVSIFHYEPGRPDLITHKYNRNVPESIIDYSDALRFKFKQAGVHDTNMLSLIMSSRTDTQVMTGEVPLNPWGDMYLDNWDGQTVSPSHPFNARYAVKYPFFLNF
jgi:hypothetical protein